MKYNFRDAVSQWDNHHRATEPAEPRKSSVFVHKGDGHLLGLCCTGLGDYLVGRGSRQSIGCRLLVACEELELYVVYLKLLGQLRD